VLSAVEQLPDVCSVLADCGGDTVDVVSSCGLKWTLLSAASARRLPRVFKNGLSMKVLRLLQRARQHPILFRTPQISFCSLHPLPLDIRCSPSLSTTQTLVAVQCGVILTDCRSWLELLGVSVVRIRDDDCGDLVRDADDSDGGDLGAAAQEKAGYRPTDADDAHFSIATTFSIAPATAPAVPLWCVTWMPSLVELASCSFDHPLAHAATFLLDVTACIALVSAITADDNILRLPLSSPINGFNHWQQSDERRIVAERGVRCASVLNSQVFH
jgi:hypothetical protein